MVLVFVPLGALVTRYLGPDEWTEPADFGDEGFIPWRTKLVDGVPYMLGYVGGENIYDMDGEGTVVLWLTTDDGEEWVPVVEGQPDVISGGVSETDFVFLDDGTLIAVSRNERGDDTGFGSKICRAEAGSLGDWECVNDPRKYDSPLLFRHQSTIYLIGRRNLNETGHFDLGEEGDWEDLGLGYQLDYWSHPKRCALWTVDPDSLEVEWVLDLPSAGDTCFPGLVQVSEQDYLLANYTSPLDDLDISWVQGQNGRTSIYRVLLSLPLE